MTTVLIIIAPKQFSEKELFTIKTEQENAGYKTVIASISIGLCYGSLQSHVTATQSLSEIHTAGLVMMMDSYPSSWAQVWMLRETELGFEPGSQFSYSNVGYNVLQCVIQTVTGLSFDAALR